MTQAYGHSHESQYIVLPCCTAAHVCGGGGGGSVQVCQGTSSVTAKGAHSDVTEELLLLTSVALLLFSYIGPVLSSRKALVRVARAVQRRDTERSSPSRTVSTRSSFGTELGKSHVGG